MVFGRDMAARACRPDSFLVASASWNPCGGHNEAARMAALRTLGLGNSPPRVRDFPQAMPVNDSVERSGGHWC